MTMVERTAVVAADPARVARLVLDLDRWPRWLPTVTALERADAGGAVVVGSTARVWQPRLPVATWTVTEVRPGHGFTWESSRGGVRTVGRHDVQPDPGGALVRIGVEQTGPLSGLAWLLLGRLTTSYVEREAAAVKQTCEQ